MGIPDFFTLADPAMASKAKTEARSTTQTKAVGGPVSIDSFGHRLRFGVAQFGRYDPLANIAKLEMWGFDYCEPAVVRVMSLGDMEFREVIKKVASGRIRVEAMNSFVPADLKLVGPQTDYLRVRDYLRRSLARAKALGAKVIVFGSGDARMVPDGFSKERAWVQLRDFLRMAGDEILQNRYDMVIGIEALRKAESNIVNTAAEAYELAVQTNHPKIRMMVDLFHMASEGENPEILRRVAGYIVHFHLSDPSGGRTFPNPESENVTFREYFSILRAIGYQGRLSLEANTNNFDADAPAGLATVRTLCLGVASE